MKSSNSTSPIPHWFTKKYQHELYVTSASQKGETPNLVLVGVGNDQNPDLPPHVFQDLKKLAKETRQTVEGIFTLKPSGFQAGGEAGKYTVQANGTVLQDTQQTGETVYLRKNYFSGPNLLKPIA